MEHKAEPNLNNKDQTNNDYQGERPLNKNVYSITLPDVPLDELPHGFFPGDKISIIEFKIS